MTMQYLDQPSSRNVFGTCICHGRNVDGVEIAREIPGYGGLIYICAETILEGGKAVRIGRARKAKRDKAAAAAKAQAEAV